MKHTPYLLLLSLLLAGCGLFQMPPRQEPAPEAEQIDAVARAVHSTVALLNDDFIFCSGIAVEGAFITAHHCISDAQPFRVRYMGKEYEGAVTATLEEYDLAAIDAVGARMRASVPLSDWAPQFGMFVIWLGYPAVDSHLHLFRGGVSAPVDKTDPYLFDIDGQFIYGNSGGPVLDERGRLLGIVSSTAFLPNAPYPQIMPIGHAVRPEYIKQLLDSL